MAFLIRSLQTYNMQLLALLVFKTPEIRSTVELLSSEAGANGSLQNGCYKHHLKLPVWLARAIEKDFSMT